MKGIWFRKMKINIYIFFFAFIYSIYKYITIHSYHWLQTTDYKTVIGLSHSFVKLTFLQLKYLSHFYFIFSTY